MRKILGILFILSAAWAIQNISVDIYGDVQADKPAAHIISDAFLAMILVISCSLAWFFFRRKPLTAAMELNPVAENLPVAPINAKISITAQLRDWQLTRAESDVAIWILRGLNFYQIADLLEKSERTVRQQAISIYAKAGFRNRAEFAGYFFDDLLEPVASAESTPHP